MNIFLKLFNLFKKNTINNQGVEMISLNSKFVMPQRGDYKDKDDIQKIIDYYKKRYLEILSSKKTITSSELDLGTYYDEIKMYIELLNRICMKEDYSDNERQLIDTTKLTIYKYKIFELEIRTKARLIALDEIKHSPKILFRNRNAINEEIEHLKNNTIIAQSNRMAAENEINAYRIRRNIDNIEVNDEKLKEKYKELCTLANGITNARRKKEEPLVTKTAKLEVALEKYAFLNKEELHQMENRLQEIEEMDKSGISKSDLLEIMNSIKRKYGVFIKFGDLKDAENRIKRFYSIKFDIIAEPFIDYGWFNHFPSDELDYYKKIVLEKIMNINMGKNSNLKLQFGEDEAIASNIIMQIFRNMSSDLNVEKIMRMRHGLPFIKAFDSANGVDAFFAKAKIPKGKDVADNRIIQYNFDITYGCRALFPNIIFSNELMDKLYRLREKHRNPNYFYIPNGITEIAANYDENVKYSLTERENIRILRKLVNGKIIVLPCSLRMIDCSVFGKYQPLAIIRDNSDQIVFGADNCIYYDSSDVPVTEMTQDENKIL